mmetsp:Transcript_27751/g.71409  ORF Transcript_27751/g.71409 Transcript_27751/m.71409 type:complete len:258 (-) Transcript_27751:481-1254(-)
MMSSCNRLQSSRNRSRSASPGSSAMLRHASQHNRRNILAWDLKFPAGECVYSTRETAQAFKCFRSPTLPRNYLEGEGTCSASGALQAVVPQALAHGDIQLGAPRLAQVQGRVDLCLCPLALHHKLGDSIQLWHLRKQHPPLLHSLLGQRRVQQQLIIHNAHAACCNQVIELYSRDGQRHRSRRDRYRQVRSPRLQNSDVNIHDCLRKGVALHRWLQRPVEQQRQVALLSCLPCRAPDPRGECSVLHIYLQPPLFAEC